MILDQLASLVGKPYVVPPAEVEQRYLVDETGGRAGAVRGLVRPASTEEVSQVLKLCLALGQKVVVQGGRTGMARGALPCDGELILSLERMTAIEEVDTVGGTMTVGAGCLLATAQQAASDAQWRLGVDIGARGSCTIGGMIATNAGGHEVLRYGMMREQVLGLEVVLADGTIVSAMNRMLKNNSGYDVKHLFIGSEGTLGIVTRAVLRLHPAGPSPQTALCAVGSYDDAMALLRRLERWLPRQLTAYEVMWADFLEAACARDDISIPFGSIPLLAVLLEIEDADEAGVADALTECLEGLNIADAVLAKSQRERTELWALRDAIGPLVSAMAIVEPFDVSVPNKDIGRFVSATRDMLKQELPDSTRLFFGHIADGNVHIALGLVEEGHRAIAKAIVYDAVREIGGSISAEHGIGLLKRSWLGHSRTSAEIGLMRALRQTFNPLELLNPGRIF